MTWVIKEETKYQKQFPTKMKSLLFTENCCVPVTGEELHILDPVYLPNNPKWHILLWLPFYSQGKHSSER